MTIGRYPTPTEPLFALSKPQSELWIKRDDLSGEAYGGNKVRKLEYILEKAKSRDKKRIVTVGAAGSHHVLATTLYASRVDLQVEAVLVPQPRTAHAVDNLRAGVGLGLRAHAVKSVRDIPKLLPTVIRRDGLFVPPGGSNITGTLGYLDGALELADAIQTGCCPRFDAIVVALGSGGTAAGILAGVVSRNLDIDVIGVRIVEPHLSGRAQVIALSMATSRAARLPIYPKRYLERFKVDGRWLGRGYGHFTEAGERATRIAADHGILLDPTYTAKAFAAALDFIDNGRYRRILYWHTLSSAPLTPLLENAPQKLDRGLRSLFV